MLAFKFQIIQMRTRYKKKKKKQKDLRAKKYVFIAKLWHSTYGRYLTYELNARRLLVINFVGLYFFLLSH